ncbi:MAG: rhodanese-like domain-containing protein [Flavobacteriaceae bacterium]|nr:rhodanese-like domain-containing protein [Flavobacteriaceae bacterium]
MNIIKNRCPYYPASLLLWVLLFVLYSNCFSEKKLDYQIISAEKFKELIDEGHPLIDVRRPEEFESGSIPGAVNFNVLDSNFAQKIDTLDRSKLYLIHCRSGKRSGRAAEIMIELGFKKIYDLQGGYLNWVSRDSIAE